MARSTLRALSFLTVDSRRAEGRGVSVEFSTVPDEAWFHGYQHEIEAFYRDAVTGHRPECDSLLAGDTIATVYAAYLSAEQLGKAVAIPRFDEHC